MTTHEEITELLRSTGLSWAISKGKKHYKIWLHDRMVGIMPLSGGSRSHGGRARKNVIAQIRRVARKINQQ